LGAPNRSHPEPQSIPAEQYLAMLHFEQRNTLAELPDELVKNGRDDFV
jgi:hypothetical protein